ncbi:MBL fold metallo-hydrolase [Rhodococcus koreensis]|uniref:MBL fold metallo-hydrolase n=1 Tax=Rhodococcus koreensis TaxID=99653 RepID=UPI00366F6B6C
MSLLESDSVDAVRPASEAQFRSHQRREYPPVEEFRPGIWSLAMPYRADVPYTLSYLIRDDSGGTHLVDPGFDTLQNRQRLTDLLAAIGIERDGLSSIIVTHLHGDHLGLGHWLGRCGDTRIHLHAADLDDLSSGDADNRYSNDIASLGDRWGVPETERGRLSLVLAPSSATVPDRISLIEDDQLLAIPGRQIRAIQTPGHTRGHLSFALDDERVLLTGDHVLPGINPGIGRGGVRDDSDPIRDYLASLDRLEPYDDYEIAPGHGYRFWGLDVRRRQIRAHVLRRAQEVDVALVTCDDATVWKIASQLTWSGGADRLEGGRLQSALLQTDLYMRFVRGGGVHESA